MADSKRRERKRRDFSPVVGPERWLSPYAGFATLCLIFLILIFTVSQIDAKKYARVANSFSIVLTGLPISDGDEVGLAVIDELESPDISAETSAHNQAQLDEIKELLNQFIMGQETGTKLDDYIKVYEQERGLVISFRDSLIFRDESTDLIPGAANLVSQVGDILLDLPNYIRVEGHTDDSPINTDKFSSNWELSVLRASELVHILHEEAQIPALRLSAIGYGETRPLVASDNSKDRAMNRRVDIVVLKMKYDYFEAPSSN
ncbi:MAG TPA: OmpA family protein [Syntrophomonadaceae bacterium]|nr:OmpA family protein [Syntrophomonadaceae bacterium]